MSKPNSIYWRTACLIALTWSVTPILLLAGEFFRLRGLYSDGIVIGTVFSSTVLAAAWTSFGPANLLVRLPLSLLWAALMGLSIDVSILVIDGGPRSFGYFTLLTSALWLVAQVPFWGVSLYFRLKLWHQGTLLLSHNTRQRQFGIRQLMIFTAFIAILLGVGRWLLQNIPKTMFDSDELKLWTFLCVSQIAMSGPLVCTTMLPRYVPAGVIISLLLIAGVAAAQMSRANQLLGGFPGNEFWLLTATNVSGVVWVFLFAVVVRYSGYHFGVPAVAQGAFEK